MRPIEVFAAGDPATWHAYRRRDVTASVAAALFGVHPFVTPFELYALKSGALAADPEVTGPMRRGTLLEPVAVQLLAEKRPRWRLWHNTGAAQRYYRDGPSRIGATPDVIARRDGGKIGAVQLKSVEPSVFRRRWFNDDGELEAPLYVAIQAIVEATMLGGEWAACGALVIGHDVDMHIAEVPLHGGVYDRLVELSADFWRRIAERDPPPADYGRDGETIANLYASDNGTEIDLSRDNRIGELLDERERLKGQIAECERAVAAVDAEITDKLGAHERAYVPGWSLARPSRRASRSLR